MAGHAFSFVGVFPSGESWSGKRCSGERCGHEQDRKSTRLNSSHTVFYTLSLHDALPILAIMLCKSSSDCFCTSAERRSRSLNFLPMGVAPLPSAPWQATHLAL